MKVLSTQQIREADRYTINNEPVSSLQLMERASRSCADWLLKKYDASFGFVVVCGNGNNGGDGLCIARMLSEAGRKVDVKIIRPSATDSVDFLANLKRLKDILQGEIQWFEASFSWNISVGSRYVVVDAIFGTGLSREPAGIAAEAIAAINNCGRPVVSIDIPSGLFGDDNTSNPLIHVVRAQYTLTFQSPKLSFFFPESGIFAGEFVVLDIGLHPVFLADAETPFHYLTTFQAANWLQKRKKFSHKGTFGHALIVAGSEGKSGAASLCAKACLRAGAGKVTVFGPEKTQQVVQATVPEAMFISDGESSTLSGRIPVDTFNAIGVGPGIVYHGAKTDSATGSLKQLINEFQGRMVWDADALNILSENKTWLAFLPPQTILTPHPAEFDRLTGKHTKGYQRMQTQRELAVKHKLIIVLKGAHTSVAMPDGSVYFNSSGNPGMATGGSGDVLTGIITAFLAQGYTPSYAALLGVHIHGIAGDIAASVNGQHSLIAGDIIDQLPGAFRFLQERSVMI